MDLLKKINIDRIKKILIMIIMDVLGITGSFFMALWIRNDFSFDSIPADQVETFSETILIWAAAAVVVFAFFKLYNRIWTFASISELFRIILSYIVLAFFVFAFVYISGMKMWASYYVFGAILSFVVTVSIRFAYRGIRLIVSTLDELRLTSNRDNIMVIGAGEAGRLIINEFRTGFYHGKTRVCCIIDDSKGKIGKSLQGVPVVGDRDYIPEAVKRYNINKIIFAIPSIDPKEKKAILGICSQTACKVQVVPGMYRFLDDEIPVSKLRKVDVVDLLGRDPITVNTDEILGYVSGKVIMVTGGGGSIGSELCRQIAKSNPKLLIIFDIYENNAYAIQQELQRTVPELNMVTLIGSVRNTSRVDRVLKKYKPDIIFHAVAHKHVPLMEDSPNEAIKNNVFGTYKMAKAAAQYNVSKFVLISTDKAVNPTNIMGASKRLCEMVVQMMNRESKTEFVAVRFGNVLGSNGSVIPLFQKQIEEGGPVTVTHPDIIRYFMTIPEAVSLVLQAGYYAKGGEIFVLDMGDPVKIDTMARNLIKLSGYEPDVDIKVTYTGLRPGEKLYEELLMDEEGLESTANKL
ncbi:MAG: polysaccharide biosynthesis protein, partial [Clostridia bacterium]|nr:polysaccharide biosynthesis protein [Clostridia bacterium]